MSVFLSPVGGAGAQFFDNNGTPLSGGKLYTYLAGTTTPQATYTSVSGATPQANPIVLDAAGRVPGSNEIWLTSNVSYKFILKDSNDIVLATWDNVSSSGDPSFSEYTPATSSLLAPGPLSVKSALDQITNQDSGASVVGYLPPFTGSAALTTEAKLAQRISVKDFGAIGDGITDNTAAIQAALDAAAPGQYVEFPESDFYVCGAITVPSGVHLLGNGKGLYGATVTFGYALSQVYGNHISNMWNKRCTFAFSAPGPAPGAWQNNITFERCYLDGTNLADGSSVSGTCISIGEYAFDIHLLQTYIGAYTTGVQINGDDGVSTPYIAAGVFTTFTDSKIFNCTTAINVVGSCADGTTLHLSNVLLDTCTNGMLLLNRFPRYAGQGEVVVLGKNVRLENCSNIGISNNNCTVLIDGLWTNGNGAGSGSSVANIVGFMKINGRIASAVGVNSVYNAAGQTAIVDGLISGTVVNSATSLVSAENTAYNLKVLRFTVQQGSSPGLIKLQLTSADGVSFAAGLLDTTQTGDLTNGASQTVGTGDNAITFGYVSPNIFTVQLSKAIRSAVLPTIVATNVGSLPLISPRTVGATYAAFDFTDTSGAAFGISNMGGSTKYITFDVLLALQT